MAKYVFGIDLGTTYSCISYCDETGRPVVVKNNEGTNTTPSVVNYTPDGEVVVGQVAKENSVMEPDRTVSLVKTLMGKTDFAIEIDGESKSPEEVSSCILKKVTGDAAKLLDTEVKDVVITCPAYFGTAERKATEAAGRIAGLNVLAVINEPTAAAICYGCTKSEEAKNILVFDLGGGTFDVTIMKISSSAIEVVCSDGNHELGGKDWDEAVMRYLVNEFISQKDFDGEIDEFDQAGLRLQAEQAKQQLTSRETVPVMVQIQGIRAKIELTRTKFDEITKPLLLQAIEKTDAAIATAKNAGVEIDDIILVGGSTRMKQVEEALVSKYGKEPKQFDPDEAVAKGAAIHAVNVYVEHQIDITDGVVNENGEVVTDENKTLNPDDYKDQLAVQPELLGIGGSAAPKIINATTKSFAIQVIQNGETVCNNMIIKNTSMPDGIVAVTKVFGSNQDNQETAELVVFENDFMDEYFPVNEDLILGTAVLPLSGDQPAGSPIKVTFKLNSEGMLFVTGVDEKTGKEVNATMQASGIMADDKVEELREKSKDMVVM